MSTDIARNVEIVRERIARACERAGRSSESVILIAVSKTVEVARIQQAIAAGVEHFGENYYQEAREKIQSISAPVCWHFIGHLQKNKARGVVPLFEWIHTVDDEELAWEIHRRAQAVGKRQRVLIEVNIAREPQKYGVLPEELWSLVERVVSMPHLQLEGLMGMAPLVEEAEQARPYFAALRRLFEQLPPEHRVHLSMGMTQDFEVAIEEGATMVRLGTAIFGPRA
ncbi:MAG: YggS family pyridoxal phosphate-dependent enzyme [Armatimonadota bacterium]|nr:YggS family pyridoxal phosphate-dependent enzyme [bacterium]MCS7309160.1 YggS family pyridoxal phosphate-dependent enzyme [Armatimonadota bacterium]MDW8104351.1 YggS family pyridoxal phosphate-dependent enzyme [Armatimonadota bacterium]MDW8289375.1 YggS family pyridoxal phosphate-dependent enzyme [Armatimonadota bacterium]